MRSIADDLRLESAQRVARLTADERLALALRLGDEDVASYQAANGVSERDARATLARARGVGRLPSRSNDPDQR